MTPFRNLQRPDGVVVPTARPAADLLALSLTDDTIRVVFRDAATTARIVEIDRRSGRVSRRENVVTNDADCRASSGREGWAVFERNGNDLRARSRDDASRVIASSIGIDRWEINLDGVPCVLVADSHASRDQSVGPALRIDSIEETIERFAEWSAPASSRALIAATSTVYGPVALFSTDRDDEIDVCVAGREGQRQQRTVSLGRGQRFECAAGGGSKIAIVSRGEQGLVIRTLASDVRSELNTSPVAVTGNARIGNVRCTYANGAFVVAHGEEFHNERSVRITIFADEKGPDARIALASVDALVAEGKDLAIAALVGGASTPMLYLYRMDTAGSRHRRYAYPIDEPPSHTAELRRALLVDVCHALAHSLGTITPAGLQLRSHDERSDVASFSCRGPDASRDLAIALLVREDGTGVATVRMGGIDAPDPRGLSFVERVRQAVTGDDDDDPTTTRLELESVTGSIESVVSAVGVLRAIRT